MELLKIDDLENDEIKLKVKEIYQGNEKIGLLPAYLFDIFNIEHKRVGYCDLRIGYNEEAYYGGHIGYLIYPPYGETTMLLKLANYFSNWQRILE